MTTSDSINPLGYGETDQIDPVVAESLTPYQVEWLSRQCKDLGLKRLQILRQALFEWIDEHPDYRFSASTFGYVMRVALEDYMNRHEAEFVPVRPRTLWPPKGAVSDLRKGNQSRSRRWTTAFTAHIVVSNTKAAKTNAVPSAKQEMRIASRWLHIALEQNEFAFIIHYDAAGSPIGAMLFISLLREKIEPQYIAQACSGWSNGCEGGGVLHVPPWRMPPPVIAGTLLNRPEGELLSYLKSGMLKVNEVDPTVVTSTDERFVFSKSKGGEWASIICNPNTNDHVVFVDQPMGGDNNCGDRSHMYHFLRLTSSETDSASWNLRGRRGSRGREEVERIRKGEIRCAKEVLTF